MGNSILHRASVALLSVSPVMLGDELLFGILLRQRSVFIGSQADAIPSRSGSPTIFDEHVMVERVHAVTHRQSYIALVVHISRDPGDGPAGDNFFDEDDCSADLGYLRTANV